MADQATVLVSPALEVGDMRPSAAVTPRGGAAPEILEHVRAFEAAGVQHLTLSLVHPPGPKGIEMLAPVVDGLRR